MVLKQLAQTRSGLIAIEPACGDIENKGFPLIRGQFRLWQEIVALEKNQTGGERRPLISVDEGVISAEIKQVSGGDFYRVGDERLPHHRRLRRCYSRFQQRLVADASRAAVSCQHFGMNRSYGRYRQVFD